MKYLSNLLKGDNCSMLFFILVFLALFTGNGFGSGSEGGESDDCTMLFFIIIFLLLFTNNTDVSDEKC